MRHVGEKTDIVASRSQIALVEGDDSRLVPDKGSHGVVRLAGMNAAIDDQTAKGIMEFIFCMPPSVEGKNPGVMTNMHGYYVLVNQDTNRTMWGHKFCEHLVRPEAIALCVATGLPPVRESFWGQVGEDPNMRVGVRMVQFMHSFGKRRSAGKITRVLVPQYFSAIFSRQMSEKEGLDRLAEEGTALLQEDIAAEASGA